MRRLLVWGVLLTVIVGMGLTLLDTWTTQETRTADPLVASMHALSELTAGEAELTVVVDDVQASRGLPEWISSTRSTLVASGVTRAVVDLRGDLDVSVDGDVVTVHLPRPKLTPVVIDATKSRVVARQLGAAQRLSTLVGLSAPPDDTHLWETAAQRLDQEAGASDLRALGERSTVDTLNRLAAEFEYRVEVVWEDS